MSKNSNSTESSGGTGFVAKSVSLFSCAVSLVALSVFVVSHLWRSDDLMMATIFPVALWLVCGLSVSAIIVSFKKLRIGLLAAWLIVAIALGDAPFSLIRGLIPQDGTWAAARSERELNEQRSSQVESDRRRAIRVISINCSSSIKSVRECMELNPDIILMQESPPKRALLDLVDGDLGDYSLLWSADASMLVRGIATAFPVPGNLEGEYVFASVELIGGGNFNVAGLRLIPSVLRFDVWNRDAWSDFSKNRLDRREQMADIEMQIGHEAAVNPTIIGGDFNAPAGDAIFDILRPTFRDAYVEAGRGWGKTIVNDYPAQRIDQVWITSHFEAESVTAQKTIHTDHRMVICDLWLAPSK